MRRTPLDAWIAHKIGQTQPPISRADLEAYQLDRLRAVLRFVREKSPFYRKHLIDVPPDVTSLADLTCLPFTTAEDIRNHSLQFVCGSQDSIQRIVTLDSSGTTGQPKRIYFTREDQELTLDFFHIGMSTFTDPGDHVLILLPGDTPGSVGDLLATALERLGAVPIKHGPVRDPSATMEIIRQRQINVMVGLPTHVLALARHHSQPVPRLKSVLLTADHVPNAIKRTVENMWRCTVYNHYGMTEMGLGGGVECEGRCGYHLREADMLFEIVDPVTGTVLPDGDYGEVVFTTLTRQGMPLIRYRTGDVSRFIPRDCPCGTTLKLLERITHRLSGRIPVGDGYLTIADLDEILFSIDGVLDFTATMMREKGRDCLHLIVKVSDDHKASAMNQISASPFLHSAPFDVRLIATDVIPASMAKRAITH